MSGPSRQRRGRDRWLPAGLLLLAVAGVTAATVLPHDDDELRLPDRVAGLGAAAGTDRTADLLVDRLGSEPGVAQVGLGRYADDDRSLVVLRVLPEDPLTDEDAGRLTARLLAAVDPRRGTPGPRQSVASQDGLALLSCSAPGPDAWTCVTVEASQALLVLASGWPGEPLDLVARVRDDVG